MDKSKYEFDRILRQLEKVKALIHLDENIYNQLLEAQRVLVVSIPVRMDNGFVKIFTGYRSQYNNARGPYKGGIRFHPGVSYDEVKTLSAWMTFKVSVVNLPLGGGKGGIIVDPKSLSDRELEALSRGYIRAIHKFIGPNIDIPAPDVNTDPRVMGWMLDEYEKVAGHHAPGVITGKPLSIGGSEVRAFSTAQGGAYVLDEAAKKIGLKKDATVAIQGFGNAGSHVAKILQNMGYKIIAVSDSKGIATNCKGLAIDELIEFKEKTGSVINFPGGKVKTGINCYEEDADILIPAALENTINKDNAGSIKAKLIVELANGPITEEADQIFEQKNILVVPDILANAGGVTVSYIEQVQNAYNFYWSEEKVARKLEIVMRNSFKDIWEAKEKYQVDMRTAAYVIAVGRVAEAMKDRGWG